MNLVINPHFNANYGHKNNNNQNINFKSLSCEKSVLANAKHLNHFASVADILDRASYIRTNIVAAIRKSIGNKALILDNGFKNKFDKSTREQDKGLVLLAEVQKTLKRGPVTPKQIVKFETEMDINDTARKNLEAKITENNTARKDLKAKMGKNGVVSKDLELEMEKLEDTRKDFEKQMGILNHKRGLIETSIGL